MNNVNISKLSSTTYNTTSTAMSRIYHQIRCRAGGQCRSQLKIGSMDNGKIYSIISATEDRLSIFRGISHLTCLPRTDEQSLDEGELCFCSFNVWFWSKSLSTWKLAIYQNDWKYFYVLTHRNSSSWDPPRRCPSAPPRLLQSPSTGSTYVSPCLSPSTSGSGWSEFTFDNPCLSPSTTGSTYMSPCLSPSTTGSGWSGSTYRSPTPPITTGSRNAPRPCPSESPPEPPSNQRN